MKKSMCIAYAVEDGLYINLTNRCTNSCDFCIRKNGDGAYGSDSLWLLREPDAREILSAVEAMAPERFSEIVFCGYGEPTVRLGVLLEVAKELKAKYPKKPIRINTNGHSDLIHGYDTAPLFAGVIDTLSISLNAPNAERYARICHPVYGDDAFVRILNFAKNVKNYVQKTQFSVVKEALAQEELEECRRIADECGVYLRVRDYISPENDE